MVYNMVCFLDVRPDAVDAMKKKLLEVAVIFRNDPETLEWTIQQDLEVPTKMIIVERFVTEESERIYHQGNPIFQPTIDFIEAGITKPYDLHCWDSES